MTATTNSSQLVDLLLPAERRLQFDPRCVDITWDGWALFVPGGRIEPYNRMQATPDHDASREELRVSLDHLLFPRRMESDLFAALRGGDVHRCDVSDLWSDPEESTSSRSIPDMAWTNLINALEEFHSRISGPVLEKLHFWPAQELPGILPVLMLLERFPRCENLWYAHPQLAWLGAHKLFTEDLLTPDSHSVVEWSLSRGPREILQWLGLPTRRGMLRLLRRFPFSDLEALRKAAPSLHQLARCDRYLQYALEADASFLPELLPIFAHSCLPSLELLRGVERCFLRDSLGVWEAVRESLARTQGHAELVPSMLEGVCSVRRLLARDLVRSMDGQVREWLRIDAKLPAAPKPGTSCILPVERVRDLVAASQRLENCVSARYVEPAMNGVIAFYLVRVDNEETLLSLQRQGEHWRVMQFRGKNNCRPSLASRQTVRRWLIPEAIGPVVSTDTSVA